MDQKKFFQERKDKYYFLKFMALTLLSVYTESADSSSEKCDRGVSSYGRLFYGKRHRVDLSYDFNFLGYIIIFILSMVSSGCLSVMSAMRSTSLFWLFSNIYHTSYRLRTIAACLTKHLTVNYQLCLTFQVLGIRFTLNFLFFYNGQMLRIDGSMLRKDLQDR